MNGESAPTPSTSEEPLEARARRLKRAALIVGGLATAILPINVILMMHLDSLGGLGTIFLLGFLQIVLGIAAMVLSLRYRRAAGGGGVMMTLLFGLFALIGLGGPVCLVLLLVLAFLVGLPAGGAWGRPLRLRGKILHPSLKLGSDWSLGAAPDTRALDAAARRALEALWLHDAQKEHASVPAFARLSWWLAAVGAPADLMEAVHRAALEEIDHARRCFALAAGYGGRAHTAEPMPDLLIGGLELKGDPLTQLAVESLRDGCLLEDYNADVAAACEQACEDPAARSLLAQIAREERSHAELSWRIVGFCIARGGARTCSALDGAGETLDRILRPTAVSREKQLLIAAADARALRSHGRLLDDEWAPLWPLRLARTRARLAGLVAESHAVSHAA